jgi:hypothetical protein
VARLRGLTDTLWVTESLPRKMGLVELELDDASVQRTKVYLGVRSLSQLAVRGVRTGVECRLGCE